MEDLINECKNKKTNYRYVIRRLYDYGFITKEIIIKLSWNKVVLKGNDFKCIIYFNEKYGDLFAFNGNEVIENLEFIKLKEEK